MFSKALPSQDEGEQNAGSSSTGDVEMKMPQQPVKTTQADCSPCYIVYFVSVCKCTGLRVITLLHIMFSSHITFVVRGTEPCITTCNCSCNSYFQAEDGGESLNNASLKAECIAQWDVAIATASKQGDHATVAAAIDLGIVPSQDERQLLEEQKLRRSDHELAPCSGEEPWIQPLLDQVNPQQLAECFKTLSRSVDDDNRLLLSYGSDCSGLDAPCFALKSLLKHMEGDLKELRFYVTVVDS